MNIEHEILSFDPTTGSILVKYFSQEFPEGLVYNIDLPVENGALPPEGTVNALIAQYKPVGQIERLVAVKTAAIPDFLNAKVPPPVIPEVIDDSAF